MRILYLHRCVGENSEKLLSRFIHSLNCQSLSFSENCILQVVVKGPKQIDWVALEHNLTLSSVYVCDPIQVPDDGYDIAAYARASRLMSDRVTLYLNSFSRFSSPKSLSIMNDSWDNVCSSSLLGCSGAMGRYSRYKLQVGILDKHKTAPFQSWLIYLRSMLREHANPHVRTNGFIAHSDKIAEYFAARKFPQTKLECYEVESGSESLTNFFEQKYLLSLNGIHPLEQPVKGGFRRNSQENLLVLDNQTDHYDSASWINKKLLSMRSYI